MKLAFKVVSISAVLLGVVALSVLAAPAVLGQTVRERPVRQELVRQQLFGGSQIGISVRDVAAADVTRDKLSGLAGAVVDDVRQNGPAAKAGMREGDVIVTFDGERIRSARHLTRLVEETPEGREIEAVVMRNGERVAMKMTATAPEPFAFFNQLSQLSSRFEPRELRFEPRTYTFSTPSLAGRDLGLFYARGRTRLGVGVQDLTEQLGEYFGAKEGALVTSVDDGTPAKTAGLKAGDVITKVNGEAVRSSAELRQRLAQASGEVTITLMRDRKEMTVKTTLSDDNVVRTRRLIR
jgi:S1-C subfamily serine protease